MTQILSETEREMLNRRIAEAELKTNAQIVLASVKRSDSYAEIPWKAFAFGISVAGFAVFLLSIFVLRWVTDMMINFSIAAILATGFIMVLLTMLFPCFARLFLSDSRKETESLQHAESLFLSHELFATRGRRGILLLVSHFERQVVILPDKGVRDKLSNAVMNEIISMMKKYLRQDEVRKAMETGLKELTAALSTLPADGSEINELSDEIIEEEGA